MEYQVLLNILNLLHCVLLYVCRLCINFQVLCASEIQRFVFMNLPTFVSSCLGV